MKKKYHQEYKATAYSEAGYVIASKEGDLCKKEDILKWARQTADKKLIVLGRVKVALLRTGEEFNYKPNGLIIKQ